MLGRKGERKEKKTVTRRRNIKREKERMGYVGNTGKGRGRGNREGKGMKRTLGMGSWRERPEKAEY